MRKLGEIFEKVTTSWAPTDKNAHEFNYYVGLEDIESGTGRLKLSSKDGYSSPSAPVSNKIRFANGDILYGKLRPNLNKVAYATIGDSICSTDFLVLHSKDANVADSKLFATLLLGKWFNEQVLEGVSGSSLPRVSPDFMLNIKVPVPPLGVQKEYAAAFATEQRIITANHNLMTLMAEKITNTLAEVWGDQL